MAYDGNDRAGLQGYRQGRQVKSLTNPEGRTRQLMDAQRNERYSRQILFAEIGVAGQERLGASSAVIIGCGALGTVLANLLVRAGLGKLRIVDRDFVEASNLQRQTLFEEADAREALPKA